MLREKVNENNSKDVKNICVIVDNNLKIECYLKHDSSLEVLLELIRKDILLAEQFDHNLIYLEVK